MVHNGFEIGPLFRLESKTISVIVLFMLGSLWIALQFRKQQVITSSMMMTNGGPHFVIAPQQHGGGGGGAVNHHQFPSFQNLPQDGAGVAIGSDLALTNTKSNGDLRSRNYLNIVQW